MVALFAASTRLSERYTHSGSSTAENLQMVLWSRFATHTVSLLSGNPRVAESRSTIYKRLTDLMYRTRRQRGLKQETYDTQAAIRKTFHPAVELVCFVKWFKPGTEEVAPVVRQSV